MYRSIRKAEEAALNGEAGEEFDTQACQLLQLDVLSSPKSPKIAGGDNLELRDNQDASNLQRTIPGEIAVHLTSQLNAHEAAASQVSEKASYKQPSSPKPADERVNDDDATIAPTKKFTFQRVDGKLRPFDDKGQQYHLENSSFEEKRREGLNRDPFAATMDDSQKSSLTPTQANSDSLYLQYDIQKPIREQNRSKSQDMANGDQSEDGHTHHSRPESAVSKQHHSVVTDSTAYTYGENDTGHVNFDILQQSEIQGEDENHEMEENVSQDASFAPRPQLLHHSLEPQTPAAPVNPFSQKGSVLKGHEMFGATQPSSIGRHMASPTSSRPSPDVYNNSSPQKRMTTSPLVGRGDETDLQSSVRIMLRSEPVDTPSRAEPLRTSSRSFDRRREPRDTYISSKESQERREKVASSSSPNSDSDTDSDGEIKPVNRQRERQRMAEIDRQLAQVTSSRPGSGNSGDIEVPSTGRRRRSERSDRDEYVAQCDGIDARDTQQDMDVIIDSQATEVIVEEMDLSKSVTAFQKLVASDTEPAENRESVDAPHPRSSPKLPPRARSVEPGSAPDLYPTSPTEVVSSPPKDLGSPLQQPGLPLQEVSTNRNDLRTPMAIKNQVMSDGADTTIPNTILETSPLGEDRIRPMGEIASLSFADNIYDTADDAPGFTQDLQFENAMRPRLSPTPPARPRVRDRDFPSFEQPAASAETPSALAPPVFEVPAVTGVEGHVTILIVPGEHQILEASKIEDTNDAAMTKAPVEPQLNVVNHNEIDRSGEPDTIAADITTSPKGVQEKASPSPILKPEEHDKDAVAAEAEDEVEIEAAHNEETEPEHPQKQPRKTSKTIPKPLEETPAKRGGLRTKAELRGPSKALRRSREIATPKPSSQRQSSRVTKSSTAKSSSARSSKRISDVSSDLSTPLSSLASTPGSSAKPSTRKKTTASARLEGATSFPPAKSLTRKSATQVPPAKEETPVPAQPRASRRSTIQAEAVETPASAILKRSSKRKSGAVTVIDDEEPAATRSSKRHSTAQTARESSGDPLALSVSTLNDTRTKKSTGLFHNMAFAVSYVRQEKEKTQVANHIKEQSGRILDEGFEKLFDTASSCKSRMQATDEDAELTLSAAAKSIGFTALIADEHSRKAKYMQALALGVPCISGQWVKTCVTKGEVVDWTPYLLCAGQSSFLGNAIRSRTMNPYSATEASFANTFLSRDKLLDRKSILLVTGKGQTGDKRKAYVFLTRVLGPARLCQVADNDQARRKLLEDESWDLLYVDKNESAAEAAVYRSTAAAESKKRKRGPTAEEENATPAPKRIRVISDEVVVQSLILGQFMEEWMVKSAIRA